MIDLKQPQSNYFKVESNVYHFGTVLACDIVQVVQKKPGKG